MSLLFVIFTNSEFVSPRSEQDSEYINAYYKMNIPVSIMYIYSNTSIELQSDSVSAIREHPARNSK
jgi:hypothetical protein